MDLQELPEGFTAGGGGMDPQAAAQKAQQEAAMEDQRRSILDQIMMPEARERLNNIAMVKKDKARALEDMLISAAKQGKLGGKVSQEQFVQMLEGVSAQMERKTKVTMRRRRNIGDSDDDNDDDLLG
ncbi:double-stranded DNA-binding domain-containing protein [Tribonema minus]|uniref:Double-stranded DNA-binding domain-containing protein n=1 Tax=Tribonema minus TaxID=303371 RepID=A0A835Z9S3_9STRA|nr:double-stranded DNA-binding domain-containing protein [Tribonema minus]|eukprot:TRINITY_DN7566_c0_g1_i1.p2 TRINITY_DN7566_c0_g1~~TRINITY_DN7566_c0_g1_i1.p2  ORF type:complete len:127 (-),score=68.45 TRINITY_DN7566_c0_g1_i1:432-812(-)